MQQAQAYKQLYPKSTCTPLPYPNIQELPTALT